MTSVDKKIITLDNFEGNFLRRMNKMRVENRLCNVSFNLKGKVFSCHDLVLATASPYFETMFNGNFLESKSRENITLNEIEPEAFEEILTAIYTSQFSIHRGNAYFILKASHMLQQDDIFKVTIEYIIKNVDIDYLIETYLFARKIERKDLSSKCLAAMAADLDNLFKIDSFNEEISFDVFKKILSHEELIKNDETVLDIIMFWNNQYKRNEEEILILLHSAKLINKIKPISAGMMAKFIVSNSLNFNCTTSGSDKEVVTESLDAVVPIRLDSALKFCPNIYLDVINSKSGAKGWVTLQLDVKFSAYTLSNFQQSNSSYKKCKIVDNNLFCFEYDKRMKKNFFFRISENGQKKSLNVPSVLLQYYDMEALFHSIYIIADDERLWVYGIKDDKWNRVCFCGRIGRDDFYGTSRSRGNNYDTHFCYQGNYDNCNESSNVSLSSPKLAPCSSDRCLYIIGMKLSRYEKYIVKVTPGTLLYYKDGDIWKKPLPKKHVNPAVCLCDKKLIISGSNHDDNLHRIVSMYDINGDKWFDLPEMSVGRANHTSYFHDGFVYVIENKSMVPNEKYNMKLRQWECIPSIPQRLHFAQNDITLVTGGVFNSDAVN